MLTAISIILIIGVGVYNSEVSWFLLDVLIHVISHHEHAAYNKLHLYLFIFIL